MIKVDILYPNNINQPNGLSQFVKKMNSLRQRFLDYGIDLNIYSRDIFSVPDVKTSNLNNSYFKKLVFKIAKHSILLTRYMLYRLHEAPSKNIIGYYNSQNNKGDILAFQDFWTCYYYIKSVGYDRNKKIILTLHNDGDIWEMPASNHPLIKSIFFRCYRRRIEETILNGCTKIGFVADKPRKTFCNRYNFDKTNTFFVYNGIEYKEYQPLSDYQRLKIVCVGTLNDRKNQLGILNAIQLLPEEQQKCIELTLVGDGDARPLLEIESQKLFSKINFIGSSNNVEKYLREANCFCLFSKSEGFPISILEAMRAGLPIIGSNIAGIPEQIIHNKTGFIVDLDNGQLSEVFRYVLNNITELHLLGENSRDLFVEKFTIDAMVEKYAHLYQCTYNDCYFQN